MALSNFIRPACLRGSCSESQERKASWMELFYDLVFMVAIAAMAERLYEHVSLNGIGQFALLFIALWAAWTAMTFYATRFDTDDPFHRLMFLAQMFCIVLVAVFTSKAFGDKSREFAIAYSALCLLVISLYIRVTKVLTNARPITTKLLIGFSVSTSFWIVSIFLPPPWRFACWGIALLIYFLTPTVFNKSLSSSHAALSPTHLPERFALFTILVLGEAIAGVTYGVEFHGLTGTAICSAIFGLVLAFGIWWIYFENIEIDLSQEGFMTAIRWEFSHLALVVSITALSVGMRFAIEQDKQLTLAQGWLLCGATGISFLMLAILRRTRTKKPAILGIICAIFTLALGFIIPFTTPIVITLILMALAVIQLLLSKL